MQDGYDLFANNAQYDSILEEMIVDYVDGTMDPVLAQTFEEYLTQNPSLAEEVKRMRSVRNFMCGLNCGCSAPDGFQSRLRRQLDCEMMREQVSEIYDNSPLNNMRLMLAMVVLAMFAGGFYLLQDQATSQSSSFSSEVVPLESLDASSRRAALNALSQVQPVSVIASSRNVSFTNPNPLHTQFRTTTSLPTLPNIHREKLAVHHPCCTKKHGQKALP